MGKIVIVALALGMSTQANEAFAGGVTISGSVRANVSARVGGGSRVRTPRAPRARAPRVRAPRLRPTYRPRVQYRPLWRPSIRTYYYSGYYGSTWDNGCVSCGYYVPQNYYSGEGYQPPAPVLAPQPKFSIGVFAGGQQFDESYSESDAAGLTGKVRLTQGGHLWLEGELSRAMLDDSIEQSRLGAALHLDLLPQSNFRLFALLGAGMVDTDTAYTESAMYAEGGIGFGYRFRVGESMWLDVTIDARAGEIEESATGGTGGIVALDSGGASNSSYYYPQLGGEYSRGRLAVSLAF